MSAGGGAGAPKLCRGDPVGGKRERGGSGEKNVLRGHALFVRFMERNGLSDCVRYFPEESMSLGNLRTVTSHELAVKSMGWGRGGQGEDYEGRQRVQAERQ